MASGGKWNGGKKDNENKGEHMEDFVKDLEPNLQTLLWALLDTIKKISEKMRTASCEKMKGSFNDFGDQQLQIDLLADHLLFKALSACGVCEVAASEESPQEANLDGKGYSVAFDPLDGSSIIDTNFAVGTICGVWPGGTLVGVSGRQMVASIVSQYGPRTTVTVAFAEKEHSHEFLLSDEGIWVRSNTFREIGAGKMFAPGNLCCTQDNAGYASLVNYWMAEKYSLRYSGGMVPDVLQLLTKRKGIFVAPSSPAAPAKLRLLYEAMPMSMLIEKAGGRSSNGQCSILDLTSETTEDRTQVAIFSYDFLPPLVSQNPLPCEPPICSPECRP